MPGVIRMVVIKRALLSCSDKTHLESFAGTLSTLGIELVASGGTAGFLIQRGLSVTTVEDFAGMDEQLDGRVKTLHPKIYAGILARRDDPTHVQSVGSQGLIDLVVVNLYPFCDVSGRARTSLEEAIEQIDIGGVALLRAAAKNFVHVAVVCQVQQYGMVAAALQKANGRLSDSLSRQLAIEAFRLTSQYDQAIAEYLSLQRERESKAAEPLSISPTPVACPDLFSLNLRKRQTLRYGENPHQKGAWYLSDSDFVWGLATLTQLQGKELSYNNLLDIDGTFRCLLEFTECTCVIVKHHTPCGVASGASLSQAFQKAYDADAESAFGGIVGFNRPVDGALAEQLSSRFFEVIVAPTVESEALERFLKKPNLRVVTLEWPTSIPSSWQWRQLSGSWLLQDRDKTEESADSFRVATQRQPSQQERMELLFAWKIAKCAKSNSVVIARHLSTLGIGQGQPSRVGAVRVAIEHAKRCIGDSIHQAAKSADEGSCDPVAASDGFFPFPDGVELLAKAGVKAIIQPGGSIRDQQVIESADRAHIAMVFTGTRHFRH